MDFALSTIREKIPISNGLVKETLQHKVTLLHFQLHYQYKPHHVKRHKYCIHT